MSFFSNLIFFVTSNTVKLLVLCLASVLGIVFFNWLTDENLSVEEANKKMVEKVMPTLPIKISETTTWVSIKANKKTIIYGYNFSLNSDQINLKVTEENLRKEYRDGLCKGDYLVALKQGTIFKYAYMSADQKKVLDIVFNEQSCW